MEPPTDPNALPKMPGPGDRSQMFEGLASMCWTMLFFSYSSNTFKSEFGHGWVASWTILFVLVPIGFVGAAAILDRRPGAIKMVASYLIYAILPGLIQLAKPEDYKSMAAELADLFTVLVIWLPVELKLLSTDLSPTGKVTVWGRLTAALNIINCFTVLRPFSEVEHARDIGYTYKFTLDEVFPAVAASAVSLAVAIPLALIMRFGKLKQPNDFKIQQELPAFVGLYMNAITEELLFRGLILNMLEQRLGQNSLIALLVSAAAYAAVHIQKSKLDTEPPNIRFACLSFIISLACGVIWRYTGKVTVSAITLAIFNSVMWRIALGKRHAS